MHQRMPGEYDEGIYLFIGVGICEANSSRIRVDISESVQNVSESRGHDISRLKIPSINPPVCILHVSEGKRG